MGNDQFKGILSNRAMENIEMDSTMGNDQFNGFLGDVHIDDDFKWIQPMGNAQFKGFLRDQGFDNVQF